MNRITGKRIFKAALFQVASSVGFLSHFSQNIPSMFHKETKTGRELDWDVADIDLLVIIILTVSGTVWQDGTKGKLVPR